MRTLALALTVWLGLGMATASAQTARWQTTAGGDPSGDYVTVERPVRDGTLGGARTVARLERTTGYTTGGITTIVLSGSEDEDARTFRVHLPYGAQLDLARGDRVRVEASSRLLGLGAVHDVRITRGTTLVVLQTSATHPPPGITIARGEEIARNGARRRFGLAVSIAHRAYTLTPGQLAFADALLMSGSDTIYEGPRPPDAFDQRILTVVRVLPLPPPAVSS